MERVVAMAAVVVVALGDRKYVKLQRSAILMTPNDMPPSSAVATGAYRRAREEVGRLSSPPRSSIRGPLATHQGWGARAKELGFTELALKMQLLIDGD